MHSISTKQNKLLANVINILSLSFVLTNGKSEQIFYWPSPKSLVSIKQIKLSTLQPL